MLLFSLSVISCHVFMFPTWNLIESLSKQLPSATGSEPKSQLLLSKQWRWWGEKCVTEILHYHPVIFLQVNSSIFWSMGLVLEFASQYYILPCGQSWCWSFSQMSRVPGYLSTNNSAWTSREGCLLLSLQIRAFLHYWSECQLPYRYEHIDQ